MITSEINGKIVQALRAKAGEDFDVLTLTEPRGIYVVPAPIGIDCCRFSCTLEIDDRKFNIYTPGTLVNFSIHQEIAAAVRARAGEEFDVLTLTKTPGICIVPVPLVVGRCLWSCMIETDGRQYDVFIG